MLNAFTVDVEDYYHVTAFEHLVSRHQWDQYPSRVVENTKRLLGVLARHEIRGTFFVVGWIGHKFPGLVREITAAGHELGCHSYWHRLIYQLGPTEFRQDLQRARDVLQDASGTAVNIYRSPSWSITRKSLWALEILCEEGFRYDSSIFPIYHDRYGIPNADPFPHCLRTKAGDLWEFPASVVRLGKLNFPVSGGGYFRLYPARLTSCLLKWINSHHRQPFLFYIHPWELDPSQPRMPANLFKRWRHYVNLSSTERKLDWLLSRFRFGRVGDILNQRLAVEGPAYPTRQVRILA